MLTRKSLFKRITLSQKELFSHNSRTERRETPKLSFSRLIIQFSSNWRNHRPDTESKFVISFRLMQSRVRVTNRESLLERHSTSSSKSMQHMEKCLKKVRWKGRQQHSTFSIQRKPHKARQMTPLDLD